MPPATLIHNRVLELIVAPLAGNRALPDAFIEKLAKSFHGEFNKSEEGQPTSRRTSVSSIAPSIHDDQSGSMKPPTPISAASTFLRQVIGGTSIERDPLMEEIESDNEMYYGRDASVASLTNNPEEIVCALAMSI